MKICLSRSLRKPFLCSIRLGSCLSPSPEKRLKVQLVQLGLNQATPAAMGEKEDLVYSVSEICFHIPNVQKSPVPVFYPFFMHIFHTHLGEYVASRDYEVLLFQGCNIISTTKTFIYIVYVYICIYAYTHHLIGAHWKYNSKAFHSIVYFFQLVSFLLCPHLGLSLIV